MNKIDYYINKVSCIIGIITSTVFVAYVLYMASSDELSYILCFAVGVALFVLSIFTMPTITKSRNGRRETYHHGVRNV